jgi:hypothetical protein
MIGFHAPSGLMGHLGLLAGSLAAVLVGIAPAPSYADEPPRPGSPEFPTWVVDRIDDMHRGLSSHAVLQMKVHTKHWTRTLGMESWSRGEDYSLVRILSPKKERGTATLKAKVDLFTYLAKTGRTIKIAGAMMGSAWMGSHLTNNDLVKAARVADHYDVTLTGKGTLDGVPHYVLAATAKRNAPVVWGKIEIAVRQSDLLPTREIFIDEDGTSVRSIEFLDYRTVDDRTIAGRMLIRPLDGSGEYTMLTFDTIDFDVEVPERLFTLQHLKSI